MPCFVRCRVALAMVSQPNTNVSIARSNVANTQENFEEAAQQQQKRNSATIITSSEPDNKRGVNEEGRYKRGKLETHPRRRRSLIHTGRWRHLKRYAFSAFRTIVYKSSLCRPCTFLSVQYKKGRQDSCLAFRSQDEDFSQHFCNRIVRCAR